jgi:pimeloyl-ACP methyl ester carboxylesterase
LLGHSLGALTALKAAARHPDAVSKLILLSANLPQAPAAPESGAGQLYGGYAALERMGALARLITSEYRRFYADPDTCRAILQSMFGANPADTAALEPPGTPLNEAYGWFIESYDASIAGMADDFRHAMTMDVGALIGAPQPAPTCFVHGAADPLTAATLICHWAASALGARTTWIAGGGHFVADSHPDEVCSAVAAA